MELFTKMADLPRYRDYIDGVDDSKNIIEYGNKYLILVEPNDPLYEDAPYAMKFIYGQ